MGIYGNVGYGKNVMASDFALKVSKMKTATGLPVKVRSNFHIWNKAKDPEPQSTVKMKFIPDDLKLPNIDFLTNDEFMYGERIEGIHTWDIIDEPYAWGLESRRSGSEMAIQMTRKSSQSRKGGEDILYLTQLPSQMDKRLKFLARSVFLALPPDDFAFHYLYMGKIYTVSHIDKGTAEKEIFPFYDTYEKIEVAFSDEFMKASGNAPETRLLPDKLPSKEKIIDPETGQEVFEATQPQRYKELTGKRTN